MKYVMPWVLYPEDVRGLRSTQSWTMKPTGIPNPRIGLSFDLDSSYYPNACICILFPVFLRGIAHVLTFILFGFMYLVKYYDL